MRETAGMSVNEVGEAIDLKDPVLLELVENGKVALPFEIILRLASVLGRNDPISFVMRFTRSYNPDVWKTLEALGIGRLALQAGREREFANLYRASDAARRLSDEEFAEVLKFTKAAFEMALAFRAAKGGERRRRRPEGQGRLSDATVAGTACGPAAGQSGRRGAAPSRPLAARESRLDVVEAGHDVGDGVDDVVRAALVHPRVGALRASAPARPSATFFHSSSGRPISLPLIARPIVHMPPFSPSSMPGRVSSILTQASTGETPRLITFCRHMYGYGRPAGTSDAQTVESGT